MRIWLAAASALALAACGQTEPQDTGPAGLTQIDRLELTCATFAGLTPAALAERYGADNITTETMPGPEGESYRATLVWAGDPARRIEIVWNEAGAGVASVGVDSPSTAWQGQGGVSIGSLLPEVERVNGRAFKLWGFAWDYGGWVSDWTGGALAPANGCMNRVRFEPSVETTGVSGDSEFQSDTETMRRAAPRVAEVGLAFVTPE